MKIYLEIEDKYSMELWLKDDLLDIAIKHPSTANCQFITEAVSRAVPTLMMFLSLKNNPKISAWKRLT